MNNFNWLNLRVIDGSQDAAFEELCRQLVRREPDAKPLKWVATGTIDGGVEGFGKFPDGSIWGLQAKWFVKSLTAGEWAQIDESVDAALSKRPKLVRYTICLPINLSDSPRANVTTARQQWEKHKARYVADAAKRGMTTQFELWDSHELLTRLIKTENRGLTTFFFGGPTFEPSWFSRRAVEATRRAGDRYSPHLRVETPLNFLIDGITCSPRFIRHFGETVDAVQKHKGAVLDADLASQDAAGCEKALNAAESCASALKEIRQNPLNAVDWEQLAVDVDGAIEAVHKLSRLLYNDRSSSSDLPPERNESARRREYDLRQLSIALRNASDFARDPATSLSKSPFLLLVGGGGTGKTHFFSDVATLLTKQDLPAVLLFGDQFSSGNPWSSITRELDVSFAHEELLGALQSIAEMKQTRALILLDALNEGVGAELWRDSLAPFVSQISRFPNVALVVSVRDTFEESVIRPDTAKLFKRVPHLGFSYAPLEAQRIYFAGYGIIEPATPLFLPEFENPLFLKLFCDGLKARSLREIPRGISGITSIFDFYLDALNTRISKVIDADKHDRIVQRSLDALAKQLSRNDSSFLERDEAKAVVQGVSAVEAGWQRSLFNQLLANGLLTEVPYRQSKLIRFTYERLADYIIAKSVIDEAIEADDVLPNSSCRLYKFATTDLGEFNPGVYEALMISVPELMGHELFDFGPKRKISHRQCDIFLRSLALREPKSISERTIDLVQRMLHAPGLGKEAIQGILHCAIIADHPLNADWLDGILSPLAMADRDKLWTIAINDTFYDGSALERLIYWALLRPTNRDQAANELAQAGVRLSVITLLWACSSSSRTLRDRATKAIVSLFDQSDQVVSSVITQFWQCNDPYIVQRLMIAAAAFAMRQWKVSEGLKMLAKAVIDQQNRFGLPVDLLSRDAARTIIARAVALGCTIDDKVVSGFAPPYGAGAPIHRVQDTRLFKRQDWRKVTDDSRRAGNGGLLRVKSSLDNFGDFFRYVIESDVQSTWLDVKLGEPIPPTQQDLEKDFKDQLNDRQRIIWADYKDSLTPKIRNLRYVSITSIEARKKFEKKEKASRAKRLAKAARIKRRLSSTLTLEQQGQLKVLLRAERIIPRYNARKAATWIYRRVIELGYKNILFGAYDDRLTRLEWDRGPRALERIGKKYQWIAFYELQARIADNFQLSNRSFSDSSQSVDYVTPHQVDARDIDATILITKTFGKSFGPHEQAWWAPEPFTSWHPELNFDEWSRRKTGLPSVENCLLVTDPNGIEWVALSAKLDWREGNLPDVDDAATAGRELWYLLNGYLIPKDQFNAYRGRISQRSIDDIDSRRDEYRLLWGELFWSPAALNDTEGFSIRRDMNGNARVSVATAGYLRESGRDKSTEDSFAIGFPIREILDGLGAVASSPETGSWVDGDGTIVAFDPTVTAAGPAAVLVRRDRLETFLRKSPYALIWSVLSEKQAVGGWEKVGATGYFKMTGKYYLEERPDGMVLNGRKKIHFVRWK